MLFQYVIILHSFSLSPIQDALKKKMANSRERDLSKLGFGDSASILVPF